MLNRPRRHASRSRRCLLVLLLAAFTIPFAHALSSDRDQPMDVTADYSKMTQGSDGKPGTTYLKGNVRVVQGTMQAAAAEATIHQNNDGAIQTVVMSGQQAHIRQQQDSGGLVTADADRIDFNNDTSVAVLTGNVTVVQQGRGEFHGTRMTYNTNTGEMESGDNTAANRVHMIIQPKPRAGETPTVPVPAAAPASKDNHPPGDQH